MSKASRPSLRASLPPVADEAAMAAARAQEMLRRQSPAAATAEEGLPQVGDNHQHHSPACRAACGAESGSQPAGRP